MIAGDASFRKYYRLDEPAPSSWTPRPGSRTSGPSSPSPNTSRPKAFRARRSAASISSDGFLLLEDMGDDTFTRLLSPAAAPARAALYEAAVDCLADLHTRACPSTSPSEGEDTYALPPMTTNSSQGSLALPRLVLSGAVGKPCPDDARKGSSISGGPSSRSLRARLARPGAARLSRRQSDVAAGPRGCRPGRPSRLPGRRDRPCRL